MFEPLASGIRTYDFRPQFSCLSRLLKHLGGHLKSLKLFKTQRKTEKAGGGGSTPSLATIFSVRLPKKPKPVPFCSNTSAKACRKFASNKSGLGAGVYPMPIGTAGICAVDVRDIAEAAAISLTAQHDGSPTTWSAHVDQ
jgi:hypothetical protein